MQYYINNQRINDTICNRAQVVTFLYRTLA